MIETTEGNWFYNRKTGKITTQKIATSNKRVTVATMNSIGIIETDNNGLVMAAAKQMYKLLKRISDNGASSDTLEDARDIIADIER